MKHTRTSIQVPKGVFDLAHPDPDKVDLEWIAQCLGGIRRFSGLGVTVAQHSMMVGTITAGLGGSHLLGLLHDAHEAYIGDITTPVKRALEIDVRPVECMLFHAIYKNLGLTVEYIMPMVPTDSPVTRRADMLALDWERRRLFEARGYLASDAEAWGLPEISDEDRQRVDRICDHIAAVHTHSLSGAAWLAAVRDELGHD